MTSLSLIPEGKKLLPKSSKSTESLISSSSSKYSAAGIYRKSTTNVMRQASLLPANTSDVRQRVLSARRLRSKSLQNQLVAAQHTIAELANENRILRTIHKRQDSALAKYENTNAELPQLLHSHAEEIRAWQTKYKKLQAFNKELMAKLKQKDSIILNLSDENKHLTQLNKDKNLEERGRLTEKVKELEEKLLEKEKDTTLLARRLQLEEKNFKFQLQQEHQRYKDLQIKFENLQIKNNERRHHCDINDRISKSTLLPTRVKSYKEIIREQNSSIHRKENLKASHQHCNGNQSDHSSSSPKVEETYRAEANKSLDRTDRKSNTKNINSSNSINSKEVDFSKAIKKGFTEFDLSEGEISESLKTKEDNDHESSEESKERENNNQYNETSFDVEEDEEDDNDDSENDSLDVFVGGRIAEEKPMQQIYSNRDSEYDTTSKDSFLDIRQKISEDYKQNGSFLDTFCRQSIENSNPLEKETVQKRTNIDPNKKSKLLAALRDIDADRDNDLN